MRTMMNDNKGERKKDSKLNNWVIYCKRRGKKSIHQ